MVSNIVTFFGSVILLISGLVSLGICYFHETDAKYQFKNTFPYEMNYVKVNTLSVVGKIFLVLSFIALGFFYFIYPIDRRMLGSIEIIVSFVSIFGVLAILSTMYLFMMDMRNVKMHLIGDTFLITFSLILTIAIAIMGFWTLKTPHAPNDIDLKKIICSSVAILVVIGLCLLIFNPKLRNWAKLEEKSNEDGSKIYLRPKWFALAYTEWAFIGSIYFDALLLFIMFI